jgi:hypothetical protein
VSVSKPMEEASVVRRDFFSYFSLIGEPQLSCREVEGVPSCKLKISYNFV